MQSQNYIEKLVAEERKKYYKSWREKNKDKIKNYNSKYWQKRVIRNINLSQNETK